MANNIAVCCAALPNPSISSSEAPYSTIIRSLHPHYKSPFGAYDLSSNRRLWNIILVICLNWYAWPFAVKHEDLKLTA
jgi:hypothetical protein